MPGAPTGGMPSTHVARLGTATRPRRMTSTMTSPTDSRDDFALLDAWADGDYAAARELMRR